MKVKTLLVLSVVFVGVMLLSSAAFADTKWSQPPNYDGDYAMDYLSNYVEGTSGLMVADDFQCLDGNPVTDLHWWGSYTSRMNEQEALGTPSPATDFWVGFWTDVPVEESDLGFSHPGTFLKAYDFYDVVGLKDGWQDWSDHNSYKYEVDISDPFLQLENEIYWLSIIAMPRYSEDDPTAEQEWGWSTSSVTWNDVAVRGHLSEDTGEPIFGDEWLGTIWGAEYLSQNVAFELTTTQAAVPEPATMSLLGLGLFGLVGLKRKKTQI